MKTYQSQAVAFGQWDTVNMVCQEYNNQQDWPSNCANLSESTFNE